MSTTINLAGGAILDRRSRPRRLGRRCPKMGTVSLFGYGFLVLFSYYLLKPVRDALILSENGAEARSYLVAVAAASLVLVVPMYSALYRRQGARVVVQSITVFFVFTLAGLAALSLTSMPLGMVFFIWISLFGVMAISQFWALAADVFEVRHGERSYPKLAVGLALGAWTGSQCAALLLPRIGTTGLMMLACCILVGQILLAESVLPLTLRRNASRPAPTRSPLSLAGGFAVVLRDRYLSLLAVLVVLLNWITATGDFILAKAILQHVAAQTSDSQSAVAGIAIGTIYGQYYAWMTGLGLFIQVFVVSRIFRLMGPQGALCVVPTLMIFGYVLIVFVPVFAAIRLYKLLEDSSSYSLHNTARHALFLPATKTEKYEGQTTTDTVFWRAGDMIQAGAIYVGSTWFGFGLTQFAIFNALLASIFLAVALRARRRYEQITGGASAVSGSPRSAIARAAGV